MFGAIRYAFDYCIQIHYNHFRISTASVSLEIGGVTLASSETGRVSRTASQIIRHANYNPNNLNNDVALLRMNAAVTFTTRIQAIRLPARGETIGSGLTVRVSGWGRTSDAATGVSQQLMWVDVTTITNAQCAAVYGTSTIIGSVVCARGNPHHSTCNVSYDRIGRSLSKGLDSFPGFHH